MAPLNADIAAYIGARDFWYQTSNRWEAAHEHQGDLLREAHDELAACMRERDRCFAGTFIKACQAPWLPAAVQSS